MEHKLIINRLQSSSIIALTLADRRLFNYLLLNAFDELPKKNRFIIDFNQLQGVYGSGLPPMDRLRESIRRLMHTMIELEVKSIN